MTGFEPIPVRTLLGAGGFATSLICLRSLVEYSVDPVRLIIHEDGTLRDEQRDQIRAFNPSVEFIDRTMANEAVDALLVKHPRCRDFRRTEFMALKLFDIVLLGTGPVAYCDSDFLFLRPYTGLFNPHDQSRPIFMTDVGHAYAVRPWKLWPLGKIKLMGRLNAGFTFAPHGYLDLDFLEWLLGKMSSDPVFSRRRYWTEQTCWAALAARSGADLLDPRQVVMATASMSGYSSDAVAIHFVATHRGKLPQYVSMQSAVVEGAVKPIAHSARRVSPFGMLWTDLGRRIATRSL